MKHLTQTAGASLCPAFFAQVCSAYLKSGPNQDRAQTRRNFLLMERRSVSLRFGSSRQQEKDKNPTSSEDFTQTTRCEPRLTSHRKQSSEDFPHYPRFNFPQVWETKGVVKCYINTVTKIIIRTRNRCELEESFQLGAGAKVNTIPSAFMSLTNFSNVDSAPPLR